jgi:ribose-phosphate pyrophosphokinase
MNDDGILVFAGSGSKTLTANICSYLAIEPAKCETLTFSEGNIFVRLLENVRGRHAYLVHSTMFSPNDKFMELLFWIDAFRRSSAQSVTVVIPYFSYGKGDKKDEPRVSIRARVCADAIEAAGADRVVTMDLHAPQIQGFFRIPVDNLYGHPALCDQFTKLEFDNYVVVAPDTGFADEARQFADYLHTDVAIGDKVRHRHDERAEILNVIGNVQGRNAVIVDDFVISAGTLVKIAERLKERGALRVLAMVTHGVFTEGSMERIDASPIEKLLITDTVEGHRIKLSERIEVVSVASYFAEAIRRIHHRLSISEMFP